MVHVIELSRTMCTTARKSFVTLERNLYFNPSATTDETPRAFIVLQKNRMKNIQCSVNDDFINNNNNNSNTQSKIMAVGNDQSA